MSSNPHWSCQYSFVQRFSLAPSSLALQAFKKIFLNNHPKKLWIMGRNFTIRQWKICYRGKIFSYSTHNVLTMLTILSFLFGIFDGCPPEITQCLHLYIRRYALFIYSVFSSHLPTKDKYKVLMLKLEIQNNTTHSAASFGRVHLPHIIPMPRKLGPLGPVLCSIRYDCS